MERLFLVFAALFGFVGVALGAFGAHALKERLAPELMAVFQTAVQYQFYHALGLVAVAYVVARAPGTVAHAAGWCFVGGIMLFSGSLYALALSGVRVLGAVTPMGGLLFLVGWGALAWTAYKMSAPHAP